LVLGLGTLALAFTRLPETCPLDIGQVERIDVPQLSPARITVNGRIYEAGGDANLDYMPRFGSEPIFRLGPPLHPLNVMLSVSAAKRTHVDTTAFTCVRVTHGSETWSRRPQNYDVQSPQWDGPGPSWRMASALGGPEWPAGDAIRIEASLVVEGHQFLLVFSPFALMKGG